MIESGGIPPRRTPIIARNVTKRPVRQKYGLRLAAAAVIGVMALGLWQLTDHKVSATSSSPTTTPSATPTLTTPSVTPTTSSTTPTPTTSSTTPTPTTKTGSS